MTLWVGVVIGLVTVGVSVVDAAPATSDAGRQEVIHRGTIGTSGPEVRLLRAEPGNVHLEVARDRVSVETRLANGAVRTRVGADGRYLDIRAQAQEFVIDDGNRRMVVRKGDRQAAATAGRWLRESSVVRAGIRLLDDLPAARPEASPTLHVLLATRAFLMAAAGDRRGIAELTAHTRAVPGPGVVRVSAAQVAGPSYCWTHYAVEAIAAYIEYEQCIDGEEWYDIFGMLSCVTVYQIRAIGAFSWWLSCVGLSR